MTENVVTGAILGQHFQIFTIPDEDLIAASVEDMQKFITLIYAMLQNGAKLYELQQRLMGLE